MVVFLQELEIEAILDLSLQDFDKLGHPCLLWALVLAGGEMLDHFSCEGLVFLVDDIERDLKSLQEVLGAEHRV